MRRHKTIELAEGQCATVYELRVRDVRHLLAILTPEQLKRPLLELVREQLPELLGLLGSSLELPAGCSLDELSLSECEQIGRAWWELHRDFFGPLLAIAAQSQTLASSTAPASS